MDYDIAMEDVGESPPRAEVAADDTMGTSAWDAAQDEPSVDPESTALAPNKLHIRGLDTMSTDDVKAFVEEHFGRVNRVEWIDDESANLVFQSESTAQDALQALSAQPDDNTQVSAWETVPAKAVPSKPDVSLHIRLALQSDKKAPGAATRSRYYLFNPDQDPEERRRRDGRNKRYRDRGEDDYRRRDGYGRGRRDSDEIETFDASLYDDDEATLADRAAKSRQHRRRSYSRGSETERDGSRRNKEKELFPNRTSLGNKGSMRNRSASPLRDGLDSQPVVSMPHGAGTSNNRAKASGTKQRLAEGRAVKELFPAKTSLAGKGHMDQIDMAERTTRLSFGEDDHKPADLLSIRGTSERKGRDVGFAIKGAAGASVKELFPDKFGTNQGKELFADKPGGRARQRQKAEDLFH